MDTIKEQIIKSVKSGSFLATVYALDLQRKDDGGTLTRHLIELHNAGQIDVITEFLRLKHTDDPPKFFALRILLESIFPEISTTVAKAMECLKYLTLEARNDLVAGGLIKPFIDFLAAEPSRPGEALGIALKDIDTEFDFVSHTLVAGAKFDLNKYVLKAIELSEHTNIQVQKGSILALGGIDYKQDKRLTTQAMTAIETVATNNFDELLFTSVLRSGYTLYKKNNELEERVKNLFSTVLSHQDDQILYAATEILWLEDAIPSSIAKLLLEVLIYTKPENQGEIKKIDYGLAKLLKRKRSEETECVILFLERILLKERDLSIIQFDNVRRQMLDDKNLLNRVITKWLLSKKENLGKSAEALLPESHQEQYHLSVDKKQLSKSDKGVRLFLTRKACGWFFYKNPVSAASFIVSLIGMASKEERVDIAEILFNPLLISYPGSVKKYLEGTLANASKSQKTVINDVIAKLERYHQGLDEAWEIKELIQPVAHREAYHRYYTRLMTQTRKDAEKKSVFSNVVTKQLILYSNNIVNYNKFNSKEEAQRQEMQLQTHSLTLEIPSIEQFDHIGLDNKLFRFKSEGRTS